MALQERRAIKDTRLLVRAMAVLGVVIVGFALHSVLHVAPSIVALVGAGAMLLVTDVDVAEVLPEVEWPTLVFFMGLFAMVAGLVHTASSAPSARRLSRPFGDNYFSRGHRAAVWSSIVGAFVDNIPYTATMTPVVEGMAAQAPDAETGRALWWAFALGACFSGNGTAIAASANVVAIGIAHAPATRSASGGSPGTASLASVFVRCRSTVLALMPNVDPISRAEYPSAISLSTSSSRGVRMVSGRASPLPSAMQVVADQRGYRARIEERFAAQRRPAGLEQVTVGHGFEDITRGAA